MKSRMNGWVLLAWLSAMCLVGTAGCEDAPRHMATAPEGAGTSGRTSGQVDAPFDLQSVIRQVHFAFRPTGEDWESGHGTYSVQAGVDGLRLTPIHHPGSEDSVSRSPAPEARRERFVRETRPSERRVVKGGEVHFGASVVRRGDRLLSRGVARGSLAQDAHLELTRGEVVEHLRSGEEGVEQSWAFAVEPAGTGDVEVRMPVVTGHFMGETQGGLHFVAAAGLPGVRYAHGTWVDGRGHRTEVKARYVDGAVVLTVPHALLESSEFPAVLDPVISPESGMDQPVMAPDVVNEQTAPALEFDGTHFLVVWEDWRSGRGPDIYGARVSAAGVVLDAAGLAICNTANPQYSPAIAFDGTNFLVVWQDWRRGEADIYGTRVSPAGAVLNGTGVAISIASNAQASPAVAFDGTNYLVVWSDERRQNADIYGARVSKAGAVLDAAGRPISATARQEHAPALAFNGTDFLVVWQTSPPDMWDEDISGTRVSTAGQVLDAAGLAIAPGVGFQSSPAVASDGTGFLVVWEDESESTAGGPDIHGMRVSGAGALLDTQALTIASAAGRQFAPAVTFDGTRFLAVWADERSGSASDIYGARVSTAGVVLDTAGLPLSTGPGRELSPALAFNGTHVLVAWEDTRNGSEPDIYGARVGTTGAVLDSSGVALSTAANNQAAPAVAFDGTNYLVVWEDWRSGNNADIYATRVSTAGVVLDAAGLAIATAPNAQLAPAVAFNGTHFLVVWQDGESYADADLYGTRVSAAGAILDPAGIAISTGSRDQLTPAVASDGTDFLVVWQDGNSDTGADIYGARVGGDGVVLDSPGLAIAAAGTNQESPAVAFNGTHYLVVWQTGSGFTDWDIQGARVSTAGVVLDPAGVAISTTTTREETAPSVASDGTHFLVVWQQGPSSLIPDIYGARVSRSGVVLDPAGLAICTALQDQVSPAVTFSGNSYLVVWEDWRNDFHSDIYGARVSRAGVVQTPGGFAIATDGAKESAPTVASSGQRALVAYHRFDASPGVANQRIKARFVSNEPPRSAAAAVRTDEDTAVSVTLGGTDPDGDALTYSLVGSPQHGALSGTPPHLTYTPAADDNGSDSFTYQVNDGLADSQVATVMLTVTPVNDTPVAGDQTVSTAEDTSIVLTLSGTDVDQDALTYTVITPPAHGILVGAAPHLTYVPAADFHGEDGFTFVASDAQGPSAEASVSLTVTAVNDAPVAQDLSLTVGQGPVSLTLTATDVEGDGLSYVVVGPPGVGSLSGTPPQLTYAPPPGFRSTVSFTFRASDGQAESAEATVRLTIRNDAPVVTAAASPLHALEGEAVHFTSTAADPGGDALTFRWAFGDGATADEANPTHAYANQGTYIATLTVSDGLDATSTSLTVEVANVAPVLVPLDVPAAAEEARPLVFRAQASDPGAQDTLQYQWDFGDGSPPEEGLEVTHAFADDGTYTVTVTVTDDAGGVTQASREVHVANQPPVPEAVAAQTVGVGETLSLQLKATDAAGDRDPLRYALVEGPGALTPEGHYSWTPSAVEEGNHVVKARVSDDEEGTSEMVFGVEVRAAVAGPGPTPGAASGCGCRSVGAGQAWPGLLLLLGLASQRRRRLRAR